MPESSVSKAAKLLSARGAVKGGQARAAKLSPEQRSDAARKAASARWKLPEAIVNGELQIGDRSIPCAVLDDGTRIVSQGGFLLGIGRSRTPKAKTGVQVTVDQPPTFLAAGNLKPYVTKDLLASTKPIKYRDQRGKTAFGYNAEALPAVCRVFVEADENGDLLPTQKHIAKACKVVIMALATVGIVALVDEATGYQNIRARHALEEILERFIRKELGRWAKRFPDEFYEHLFRLKGKPYPFKKNPPQYVGHWTNNVVYKRLAPGVLEDLQKKTPKTPKGHRRHRFHQWLTEDVGHPKLQEHLSVVIALMAISPDWDTFQGHLDKVRPIWKEMPLFVGIEDEEE